MDKQFFSQDTIYVARELLGKVLCHKINNKTYKGIIVETEAYTQEDEASHAYKGITPRNEVMFQNGGISYVYFIYGMHFCMNVVTERRGYGSAVLIRALEPLENIENSNGPAKLTEAMKITKEHNGLDLTNKDSGLWIEDAERIPNENIIQTTRIGISQAIEKPWRFYIKNNRYVSKK